MLAVGNKKALLVKGDYHPAELYADERSIPLVERTNIVAIQEGEGDPSFENVRPIHGMENVTVATNVGELTVMLPEVSYGGYVDWTRNKYVQTHGCVVFDGSPDEVWTRAGARDGTLYIKNTANALPYPAKNRQLNLMCDKLTNVGLYSNPDTYRYGVISSDGSLNLHIKDGVLDTSNNNAEGRAILAANPITVVYELAESIEYDMTNIKVGKLVKITGWHEEQGAVTEEGVSFDDTYNDHVGISAVGKGYQEIISASETVSGPLVQMELPPDQPLDVRIDFSAKEIPPAGEFVTKSLPAEFENSVDGDVSLKAYGRAEQRAYTATESVTGDIVQMELPAGQPLDVVVNIAAKQSGKGDPSTTNIRPISGINRVSLFTSERNLISCENDVKEVYVSDTNGTLIEYPSWYATDYIPVEQGDCLRIPPSAYHGYYGAFYDEDKVFVRGFKNIGDTTLVRSGECYIRLSYGYSASAKLFAFIEKPHESSYIMPETTNGGYISDTNGTVIDYPTWKYTDYIDIRGRIVNPVGETSWYWALYDENYEFIIGGKWASTLTSLQYPRGAAYMRISAAQSTDIVFTLLKNVVQLPETSYGGYIDWTRKKYVQTHNMVVFNGSEEWHKFSTTYYTPDASDIDQDNYTDFLCSHFAKTNPGTPQTGTFSKGVKTNLVFGFDGTGEDINGWKDYLAQQYAAGTPVTVVYLLADPIEHDLSDQLLEELTASDDGLTTIYSNATTVMVSGAAAPTPDHPSELKASAGVVSDGANNIILPILRAIPGSNIKDELLPVNGMPGWYDVIRRVCEQIMTGDEGWRYGSNNDTQWASAHITKTKVPNMATRSTDMPMCCTHVPYHRFRDGNYIARAELGFMGYNDRTAAFIMTVPNLWENAEDWSTYVKGQYHNGTPITLWFEREEVAIERVYLGNLKSNTGYTTLTVQSEFAPEIEAEAYVLVPGGAQKTPQNPATIEGINTILLNVCGRNLIDVEPLEAAVTNYGPACSALTNWLNQLVPTRRYRMWYDVDTDAQIKSPGATGYVYAYYVDESIQRGGVCSQGAEFSIKGKIQRAYVYGVYNSDATYCTIKNFCLTADGSDPKVYTPYCGSTHTITLPSVSYGGYVDWTRKQYVRTHKVFVYTGEENWMCDGEDNFYDSDRHDELNNDVVVAACSHFACGIRGTPEDNTVYVSTTNRINFRYSAIEHTAAAVKAYLAAQYDAGTPLTVVCELVVPEASWAAPDAASELTERVTFAATQAGSGDPTLTHPREIRGVDSFTVQNAAGSQTIKLPETIYGGYIDPSAPQLVKTHAMVRLDGSDDEAIRVSSGNKILVAMNTLYPPGKGSQRNLMCDKLVNVGVYNPNQAVGTICAGSDLNIYVLDGENPITTVAEARAFLARNPITVVYETAGNAEIPFMTDSSFPRLMSSENGLTTVYSDAESVSVRMFAKPSPYNPSELVHADGVVYANGKNLVDSSKIELGKDISWATTKGTKFVIYNRAWYALLRIDRVKAGVKYCFYNPSTERLWIDRVVAYDSRTMLGWGHQGYYNNESQNKEESTFMFPTDRSLIDTMYIRVKKIDGSEITMEDLITSGITVSQGDSISQSYPFNNETVAELPVLRAIPGTTAADQLMPVKDQPGWYDVVRWIGVLSTADCRWQKFNSTNFVSWFCAPFDAVVHKRPKVRTDVTPQETQRATAVMACNISTCFWHAAVDIMGQMRTQNAASTWCRIYWFNDFSALGDQALAHVQELWDNAGGEIWYEMYEPDIERVYLGDLKTYPRYTYLEAKGNLLPDITATVKVAD